MVGPLLLIALFVVLGIVFSMGRGSFLIVGYNTMSREKRATYDVVALCKFMGKMMLVLALSQVLRLLGSLLALGWLLTFGIIVFVATIVFMLVYANTGNRFKKQTVP